MTAFNDESKNKIMPKEVWVVQNETTNLYLSVYSADYYNCQWVVQPLGSLHFNSEADAQAVIDSWDIPPEVQQQNRPHHIPLIPG